MKLVFVVSMVAAFAFAQETPTEREAARDVLKKMDALEKSLDVPGWVARLSAPDCGPRPGDGARAAADGHRTARHGRRHHAPSRNRLRGEALGGHPGGLPEAPQLRRHGGSRQSAHGVRGALSRAITARRISASSSNTTRCAAPRARSTATSTARRGRSAWPPPSPWRSGWSARTRPAASWSSACPGEEMMPPVAKTDMFKAGVFDGMDVIVRSHAVSSTNRPAPGFGTCCLNIDGVKYTFSGAPAHQMTPWAGRNALEAVIHLFNNIDAARTTMRPEARDSGRDHRRRRRAQRGARPHAGRFLHPLSRRRLPGAGARGRGQRRARRGAGHRHQGEDRQLRQACATASRWRRWPRSASPT